MLDFQINSETTFLSARTLRIGIGSDVFVFFFAAFLSLAMSNFNFDISPLRSVKTAPVSVELCASGGQFGVSTRWLGKELMESREKIELSLLSCGESERF